jgi:hypothetical protein
VIVYAGLLKGEFNLSIISPFTSRVRGYGFKTFTVEIEKFIYQTSILDIDFGTVQTFSMFGFANIRY